MNTVTSDDKLLAAISYWGFFLLGLPALLIFLIKKDESVYLRKHSLQALLLGLAVFVLLFVVLGTISKILGPLTLGLGYLLIMLVQVVVFLGFLAYSIILGVQCFQGDDTNIPYLTDFVHKNLGA